MLEFQQLYIGGAQHLLSAGQSDASDLAKCHQELLEHNINTRSVLILCVTKVSTGHLGKVPRPQDAHHYSRVKNLI